MLVAMITTTTPYHLRVGPTMSVKILWSLIQMLPIPNPQSVLWFHGNAQANQLVINIFLQTSMEEPTFNITMNAN